MKIKYKVYNPAGNITALVIGDNYNLEERKIINNKIMEEDSRIEQVGFVSETEKRLTMAGGEFCGNATRCAIAYYDIKEKENIMINNQVIKGGKKDDNIWCEIPIDKYKISIIEENIYKVELDGITMIIIKEKLSKNYLSKNLKEEGMKIITKYKVIDDAVGVIFTEKIDILKIYPVVWVKNIDTVFLENACGSGTIATSIVEAILENKSSRYKIIQPSEEILETDITLENGKITKAILKGKIYEEKEVKKLII